MKSKFIAAVFLLCCAGLGIFFFFFKNKSASEPEVTTKQAKIVNPKFANSEKSEDGEKEESSSSQETFTSFIPLKASETLISTLIFDFDNDTYEDQVIVVRKADSTSLWLVVGLYDPETKDYNRVTDIKTNISKTGTFTYSNLDVIGNHTQALIYQGVDDNGDYAMSIYMCNGTGMEAEIYDAGSFSSDGTVFIQQTERSDSYELALSNGESFSVWVYSSDKKEGENGKAASTNQIQTEYKWNSFNRRYEFNRSSTVTASRLAAKELSRIQDGTVETFAAFMDGLWYKTSNTDNTIRYLCFNYPEREIVFLNGDTEEVYNWEDSKLRHNGIYLTTTNSIISSLHRRFDIMLAGVDEIKVTVRDDVKMVIAEGSLWDGSYKKTASSHNFNQASVSSSQQTFSQKITAGKWQTADENCSLSFDGNRYQVKYYGQEEEGIYSIIAVGSNTVIQMRPDVGYSEFGSEYKMEFGTKVVTETVKNGKKTTTVEKTVVDEDALIFTPVKLSPIDCYVAEGRVIDFNALKE